MRAALFLLEITDPLPLAVYNIGFESAQSLGDALEEKGVLHAYFDVLVYMRIL